VTLLKVTYKFYGPIFLGLQVGSVETLMSGDTIGNLLHRLIRKCWDLGPRILKPSASIGTAKFKDGLVFNVNGNPVKNSHYVLHDGDAVDIMMTISGG
jgi:molybdopterin converting factor small subunit